MKIIEKIIEIEANNSKSRLDKNGKIRISDKQNLGDIEYISHEVMKGRRGKIYIQFNNNINYYPQGRFGPIVTLAND